MWPARATPRSALGPPESEAGTQARATLPPSLPPKVVQVCFALVPARQGLRPRTEEWAKRRRSLQPVQIPLQGTARPGRYLMTTLGMGSVGFRFLRPFGSVVKQGGASALGRRPESNTVTHSQRSGLSVSLVGGVIPTVQRTSRGRALSLTHAQREEGAPFILSGCETLHCREHYERHTQM